MSYENKCKFSFDQYVQVKEGFYKGQRGKVRGHEKFLWFKRKVIVSMQHGSLGRAFTTWMNWPEDNLELVPNE